LVAAEIGQVSFGVTLPEIDGQIGDPLGMCGVGAQRPGAEGAPDAINGGRRRLLDHRANHPSAQSRGAQGVLRAVVYLP
jgi:hypothetical protein